MNILRLFSLVFLLLIAACGGGNDDTTGDSGDGIGEGAAGPSEELQSLLATIQSDPRLSVLASAVDAADLGSVLEGDEAITLFAPSNSAFANLPDAAPIELLMAAENKPLLQHILSYHVLPGSVAAADLDGTAAEVTTSAGLTLTYDGTGPVLTVGAAPSTAVVITKDIQASNGVIHVIDAVLLPAE